MSRTVSNLHYELEHFKLRQMVGSALIQKPVQASKFQKAFFLAQRSFFAFARDRYRYVGKRIVNNTFSHDAFRY